MDALSQAGTTKYLWSGDRNEVGVSFSTLVLTGRGAHAASSTMGTGSWPGAEGAGPRFKKVELYLYSPPMSSWVGIA